MGMLCTTWLSSKVHLLYDMGDVLVVDAPHKDAPLVGGSSCCLQVEPRIFANDNCLARVIERYETQKNRTYLFAKIEGNRACDNWIDDLCTFQSFFSFLHTE